MKKIICISIFSFGCFYKYNNITKKYHPYLKLVNNSNNIKINDDVLLFTNDTHKHSYYPYEIVKKIDNNYLVIDYSKPIIKLSKNNDKLLKFFIWHSHYYENGFSLYENYKENSKHIQPKSEYELSEDKKLFYKKCKKKYKKIEKTSIYPNTTEIHNFINKNKIGIHNYSQLYSEILQIKKLIFYTN